MQFKALEEKLGYVFKNQKLLELALIHKSSNNISNNERLEFLGDVILSSIVSETLYYRNKNDCLLYTSPSPRDKRQSRMPSSA